LADDLNISAALASLFDFVREINGLCDAKQISQDEARHVLHMMHRMDTVLGLLSFEHEEPEAPPEVQQAFERRLVARQEKNWKLADELREEIHKQGYTIEDTPKGARLKRI
jgi:cysteinyl-tRNA synthetase